MRYVKMESEREEQTVARDSGQLTRGHSFAHIRCAADNLNNLLAEVVGNIALAKMELLPGTNVERYLMEAEKTCLQMKELTKDLLKGPSSEKVLQGALSMVGTAFERAPVRRPV